MKGNVRKIWKYGFDTFMWETIKETNLNTIFYFHK